MGLDKITGAGIPEKSAVTPNKTDTTKTKKSSESINIGQHLKSNSKEDDKKSSKYTLEQIKKIEEMEAKLEAIKAEYDKKIAEMEIDDFLRKYVNEAELKALSIEQKKMLEAEYRSIEKNNQAFN